MLIIKSKCILARVPVVFHKKPGLQEISTRACKNLISISTW